MPAMMSMNLSDIAVLNIKGSDYYCIISGSSKTEAINLKPGPHLPNNFLFISFNESPLKMMENAFYFILKALFILKIFTFMSWHFGHVEETA